MSMDVLKNNDFTRWAYECITQKYADFKGRSRRREYWMFLLCYMVTAVILAILSAIPGIGIIAGILYLVVAVGCLCPMLAAAVRRLHDINKSGWWLLLSLVPIISLYLIYLFIQDGTPGPNQYGPNPKGV